MAGLCHKAWRCAFDLAALFRRHCDYIHFNPVKHGYDATPAEWPHSTFHRFVERGMYPPDWLGPEA